MRIVSGVWNMKAGCSCVLVSRGSGLQGGLSEKGVSAMCVCAVDFMI